MCGKAWEQSLVIGQCQSGFSTMCGRNVLPCALIQPPVIHFTMPPKKKSKTASLISLITNFFFKVEDSQSEAEQNVDKLEKGQTGEVEESDGQTLSVAPEPQVENLDVISISEQACSSYQVESSSQTSVNKSSSLAQEMQETPHTISASRQASSASQVCSASGRAATDIPH